MTTELMLEKPQQKITGGLLVVLALLSAIAPFATDLYLSAFPVMTTDLHASATQVQLTLTTFLIGVAVGQLIFGPLSDRIGRFRPLAAGAALCVLASVVAATAPNIEVLVAARFAQGLTGAAGMVIGRAIIADLARGPAAARAFSLMMVVGGVAPVLAPFAGSLLVAPIGWRGVLWVVFALAVAMLVAILAVVRESHPAQDRGRAARSGAVGELLSRTYVGYTLTFGFGFAVLMAYISASPFVYQEMVGLSTVGYGAMFGVNSLGLMGASWLAGRLSGRVPARRQLGIGVAVVLGSALALLALAVTGAPVWLLPIPLFVVVSSIGLVLGNGTALALGAVPQAAGTGSAVLGALQFGLAAAVSPLVSIRGEDTAVPLAIVMVTVAVISGLAYLSTARTPAQRGV